MLQTEATERKSHLLVMKCSALASVRGPVWGLGRSCSAALLHIHSLACLPLPPPPPPQVHPSFGLIC